MQELENYNKEKLTIDLGKANIFAVIIIIPVTIIFGLPYFLLWKSKIISFGFMDSIGSAGGMIGLYICVAMILGILMHELIHGIIWASFASKGFRSIKFGVLWNILTPYCHCKEPLKVRQYIVGAIMPAIILGIAPCIIAIITGKLGLLLFGIIFTTAAGGDFLVINLIRKEKGDDLVQDHPSEAGCYIYRKVSENF